MESNASHRDPWNKGKLVGQKAPFKVKDILALTRPRTRYSSDLHASDDRVSDNR